MTAEEKLQELYKEKNEPVAHYILGDGTKIPSFPSYVDIDPEHIDLIADLVVERLKVYLSVSVR